MQTIPQKAKTKNSIKELCDFYVEVQSARQVRVLQLTDIQVIDSNQQRYPTRLNAQQALRWTMDSTQENYKNCVRQVIEKTKPDLIILTGDIVYGEFDDNGSAFLDVVEFMDSFQIPWAPVFGNHDNESKMGVDWQCRQLENAKYCLFKQRKLTGNGNYTVGIVQDTALKRVFFMMDSNGCSKMSEECFANCHSKSSIGFGTDQIEWFKSCSKELLRAYPASKLSVAFHIQPYVFKDAFLSLGYASDECVNLGFGNHNGNFGYFGRDLKDAWDKDYTVWNMLCGCGVDSLFFGHEHANSMSLVYKGVRLQYGQKSSVYDRVNYEKDGTYQCSYDVAGKAVVGGTLITVAKDGRIVKPQIVLYEQK